MKLNGCINMKTILAIMFILLAGGFLFKKDILSVINTETQCY